MQTTTLSPVRLHGPSSMETMLLRSAQEPSMRLEVQALRAANEAALNQHPYVDVCDCCGWRAPGSDRHTYDAHGVLHPVIFVCDDCDEYADSIARVLR